MRFSSRKQVRDSRKRTQQCLVSEAMGEGKKQALEVKQDPEEIDEKEMIETPNGLLFHGTSGKCEGKVFKKQEEKGLTSLGIGRKKGLGVWINDETVSTRHAEMVWREATREWWIFDQGSTNGTYLNGHLVPEEGLQLKHGDHIAVGDDNALRVQMYPYQNDATTVGQFLREEFYIYKGMMKGQCEKQIAVLKEEFEACKWQLLKEVGLDEENND